MSRDRLILPALVASQFAGGSLWFVTNAVMPELDRAWSLGPETLGHATAAVQAGFIGGTLALALSGLADRLPARWIFFGSALAGALANVALFAVHGALPLVLLRLVTGIAMAGIYPIGLRLADGWFRHDLGHAMGWLVAALVFGKALPFGLRALGAALPWQAVILAVSVLAFAGGLVVLTFVGDGPHAPRRPAGGRAFRPVSLRAPGVREAALAYFGHMWELYAFYAFVPVVVAAKLSGADGAPRAASALAFGAIAAGAVGCALGGTLARRHGSARVACWALLGSSACCLLSPVVLAGPWLLVVPFLLFWGVAVVADSGQFSALAAAAAPRENVGSTLTLMNCIGFGITIVSIELLTALAGHVGARWLLLPLAVGPLAALAVLAPVARGAEGYNIPAGD